jgi:hypothetical protein
MMSDFDFYSQRWLNARAMIVSTYEQQVVHGRLFVEYKRLEQNV